MTAPTADERAGLRVLMADRLHEALDGDYLVGADQRIGRGGADLPIREARSNELVWWAVEALLPMVMEARAKVAAVERLLTAWESQHTHLGIERGNWGPASSALRRALATEDTAETGHEPHKTAPLSDPEHESDQRGGA